MEPEGDADPRVMKLFAKCRGGVSAGKRDGIEELLLRLRPAAPATAPAGPPESHDGDQQVSAAEGQERVAARRDLSHLLAVEIQDLKSRIIGPCQGPERAQIERDMLLAGAVPEVEFLMHAEESSLRQVWRATELLRKVKSAARQISY